jgi:hypothetical protein
MTPSLLNLKPGCAFRDRCARATAVCATPPEIHAPVGSAHAALLSSASRTGIDRNRLINVWGNSMDLKRLISALHTGFAAAFALGLAACAGGPQQPAAPLEIATAAPGGAFYDYGPKLGALVLRHHRNRSQGAADRRVG